MGDRGERETYEEPTVENINKAGADVMDDGITCYPTDASHKLKVRKREMPCLEIHDSRQSPIFLHN